MKALILAAGLGTRLRPYTLQTPKPLFSIGGTTLLDRIIGQLIDAGCRAIAVNTHHLHHQIDSHLARQTYPIPIHTRYEPEILGTGGAIRNWGDFWDREPFMVVNADIFTDIDFKSVYDFHRKNQPAATLALIDHPEFNTVSVDRDLRVIGFNGDATHLKNQTQRLTFTGIQILEPTILSLIPQKPFVHSIDVYRDLIAGGNPPLAYIETSRRWSDIGTSRRYREVVIGELAPKAFRNAFGEAMHPLSENRLAGDGSDRAWYRLEADGQTLVMVDHGIRRHPAPTEMDAFVSIGKHLFSKDVPVPQLFGYDLFAGIAFLEDLGDTHLQDVIRKTVDTETHLHIYRSVIDSLIHMATVGKEDFDTSWTYQSARYDRPLILERECRYFTEAFLQGWLGLDYQFEDFEPEFHQLADGAIRFQAEGFMHRDFQSRNIMVQKNRCFFIDFQGGRLGPIQYDLASLLIDPYVQLPRSVQETLVAYGIEKIVTATGLNHNDCLKGYRYCYVTRSLQTLGAFGFLSRMKGKTYFEQYIRSAVNTLQDALNALEAAPLDRLRNAVSGILQNEKIIGKSFSREGENDAENQRHG